MKDITIIPSELSGDINIPPSKSLAHRAIISAGLSEGVSNIENIIFSEDIKATIRGMKSFGIEIQDISEKKQDNFNRKTLKIIGRDRLVLKNSEIDCSESGSTLRFLIPISLRTGNKVKFTGKGKLVSRPLDVYYNIFENQKIKYKTSNGKLPIFIEGVLKSGEFYVKGNISSQFITGLMYTLPFLNGDSKVIVTTELESKGYVDLTIDILKKFGIKIENKNYKEFFIKGNQKSITNNYRVQGDFSQGAFWIVAGILGSNIKILDLDINSLQGDRVIIDIVKNMGANIKINENYIETKKSKTKGTIIDASECPDLVPILSVLGSLSTGTTKIINAERLRIKECDRLKAMATELKKIGADIEELEDGLLIKGREYLKGGTVDSWNDHRIAMSMAIASIKCREPITIKNSEAVNKSYPDFWGDFKKVGGNIHEWNMGK
ncbi:3-phosphoshikimate 1-carboxyvinyltransferase [Clostridium botulinum]|uniref:3-phosphoshikimate 1-carboxyvinyltransferase n=1 Tax=Clostridium botulinum C/D str. DC5 TaxID=1443128 RepID=A0A0A0IC82_CLOBO|nr:3-phosphoshikimate 1-carboxyvinyltransferase [Clostridium botulinum]KEI02391.1 3-phosphoshikimate 1-carboxyvinyltransferase [Clostridium botulinum C/D str. BKT75002]KEI08265.1 3-phosphoshikimate 1-carboxyvinyltransferase [Clostridium botulinum C/D str. BKT2873]KGM98527.1 3-phosphoshikimate 1-carboxyvinyltransferase [Clostridium botulinum C/D str. DC5]KOC56248.1 3-phosphoshikimate 1-carboxyvinyltransferase [Clostridium botulinum]KOC57254.1 3-phosphoshikimate 1-carboxyvinyltransferase [Clostr